MRDPHAGDETRPCVTVTIAIATTGRAEIAARTVGHIATLRNPPDRLVLSVAATADFDESLLATLPFPAEVILGPKGSANQRNRVLEMHAQSDVILFLDDDFLIADGYVDGLRHLFTMYPDVVMATGRVLADGIHGPGLSHEAGLSVLAGAGTPGPEAELKTVPSTYGCNMAVRAATLAAHPERFDEKLPLYAWLEDMDLSRRLACYGRIVEDEKLLGVHLGTKTGRSPGLLLGYSQIANPIYMIRKGTGQPAPLLKLMGGNILANLVKSLRPEPWIDRRGRLQGNLTALWDLLCGRLAPDRILQLRKERTG
ncbi:MAG: glycosyltransferase [Sulfitobacter sp.]|nr:glycosyltransferase [Sulfitobacter sp.]